MSCPDPSALAAYASRSLSPAETAELETHLADCPDCLQDLRDLEVPKRTRVWTWAAAASLLAAVGLAALWKKGPETRVPAPVAVRKEASLEVEPGGEAALSGRTLTLRSGACWLDTSVPVEMAEPARVRFEAGTEAEVRILEPKRVSLLLSEAWASGPAAVLVSVVSGCAEAGGVRIPAGSRLRIPGGSLETVDPAPIEAWRIRSLEAESRGPERTLANASASFPDVRASFAVEVRAVRGHIVLHYPGGETTLGSFATWKDEAWHRVAVSWRGAGTEVFLDGRRLLKIPETAGSGAPGLEVREGSLVLREIRP